jgi:hypothetical protein
LRSADSFRNDPDLTDSGMRASGDLQLTSVTSNINMRYGFFIFGTIVLYTVVRY